MQPQATTLLSSARAALAASNAQLASALQAVIESRPGSAAQRAAWDELETRILHHLRSEDELLLPYFELSDVANAGAIRQDHHRIRALVRAISDDVRAACVDAADLARLASLLRASTRDKESRLYAWVDRCIRPARKGELIARLRSVPPLPRG